MHISQLIAFLPLFSIKIPKTISDLFKGFSSFGWAPNIGSHIYGGYIETNQILIDSFLNYGYKSTLFVISSGKMIFIALAFIAV